MLKRKLHIRENVNKRIRMGETLVLFCLCCKKDIYSFNTSPQVEKEKKKGMMDINLWYVAAVTSLRGDLTFLNHLLNIHNKLISSILRKNEHRVKKEDCLGHVQKRLGTALCSYKNKRWGVVLSDGKGTGSKDV